MKEKVNILSGEKCGIPCILSNLIPFPRLLQEQLQEGSFAPLEVLVMPGQFFH
jgi:hypothetical protein